MKLVLLLTAFTLAVATPVPEDLDVRAPDADADTSIPSSQWHVRPVPGKCSPIYCIRAPCLSSCCPNQKQYCPWGFSCYGSPPKCCPPGWWCDAPNGPINCRVNQC
ncbi:hypothetical protein CC85DRAFT_301800 [Cutaneotrichosporon oleaginosum]|uniref:Granulins domain-containing protein n=1 Tax=Cutaneotrichosporon oleaginosum TaxID=879819 RepID=A0A0J0XPI0_9TREE|nr:uncharacterized protein CC85DRAFT_301800 [Cutaneotrichosporon oleaginosum]KLT43016.1 hypothetical protein CC85DRAFT_301800 [Cutaneotrichosporon oleaginosum]TXT11781.1 hypothetical protein COLE_02191 [Cutaneotrichosporon oleaginosum]